MSHAKARQIVSRAKALLRLHKLGGPEHELSVERIEQLENDIDAAENHLEDEPSDFYHGDRQIYSEHEE